MRHKKKKKTLGRERGPRKALMRTMAISLIMNESITTTQVKAKAVQRFVEKLVTIGKVKSPHTIRLIQKKIANTEASLKLVNELGVTYKERPGGYTTTMKLGQRKGDGAEEVLLAFVK